MTLIITAETSSDPNRGIPQNYAASSTLKGIQSEDDLYGLKSVSETPGRAIVTFSPFTHHITELNCNKAILQRGFFKHTLEMRDIGNATIETRNKMADFPRITLEKTRP